MKKGGGFWERNQRGEEEETQMGEERKVWAKKGGKGHGYFEKEAEHYSCRGVLGNYPPKDITLLKEGKKKGRGKKL